MTSTDNARDEEPLAWCPGCGDRIPTEIVRERGVCSNCHGTSDDPWAAGRAEAWAEGHRTGWEHCQDGNYGNDYWDDPTPNPYATGRAETTTTIQRLVEENRNLRTTVDADLEYQRRLVRHLEQAVAERDQWREMYQAQVHLAHVSDMKVAAVEAAFENLPIFLSAIEKDQRRTPEGRGGEAHFIPATPGHGKSGCPGDNITRWLNEVRAALSAASTDTTKETP